MRITVLARGGLSVYGGTYDPHRNEAVLSFRDGETASITIEFPDTATSPAIAASSGATATTPTASGSKVSLTLSAIQEGAQVDVTAAVSGETKLVRIRARGRNWNDRYGVDAERV